MLFGIFAPFFATFDIPPELKSSMYLANIVSIIIPIFVIGVGVCLLKYSDKVYEFAFDDSEEFPTKIDEKLLVVLKACGIFLIIKYTPAVIQTVSSAISVKTAPPIYEMLNQQQYLYQNAFSSIFSVCLGYYLLKNGRIFFNHIR